MTYIKLKGRLQIGNKCAQRYFFITCSSSSIQKIDFSSFQLSSERGLELRNIFKQIASEVFSAHIMVLLFSAHFSRISFHLFTAA